MHLLSLLLHRKWPQFLGSRCLYKCLYDKSLREYRETEKRNNIYQDKVHELGITGEFNIT